MHGVLSGLVLLRRRDDGSIFGTLCGSSGLGCISLCGSSGLGGIGLGDNGIGFSAMAVGGLVLWAGTYGTVIFFAENRHVSI